MKTTIVILLALVLTGCNVFQVKKDHTIILVETIKDICGNGSVSVESTSKQSEDSDNSSVKFECMIDGSNGEGLEL